jgi:hypothetical protein
MICECLYAYFILNVCQSFVDVVHYEFICTGINCWEVMLFRLGTFTQDIPYTQNFHTPKYSIH